MTDSILEEVDKKIEALEKQLVELRQHRRSIIAPKDWALGAGFTVTNEFQLDLSSASNFINQLLDALPVQVFIKTTKYEPDKGRQYYFINKTARKSLGWSREMIEHKFDGDAFEGGVNSPLYHKMLNQENETIKSGKSRRTLLDWTPPGAWHRNTTLEIPVRTQAGEKIAFCAIAHDIEFRDFARVYRNLGTIYLHEYNNLLHTLTEFEGEIKEALSLGEEHVFNKLDDLTKLVRTKSLETEALYRGVGVAKPTDSSSIEKIHRALQEIYRDPHFDIEIDVSAELSTRIVSQPNAVIAVIVAMIANGEKHSPENETQKLKVTCETDGDDLIWNVCNRCDKLTGMLDLGSSRGDFKLDRGYGGAIIGQILARSFIGYQPKELLKFPKEIVDGWVCVALKCVSA